MFDHIHKVRDWYIQLMLQIWYCISISINTVSYVFTLQWKKNLIKLRSFIFVLEPSCVLNKCILKHFSWKHRPIRNYWCAYLRRCYRYSSKYGTLVLTFIGVFSLTCNCASDKDKMAMNQCPKHFQDTAKVERYGND